MTGPVYVSRNGGKKWNQVTPEELAPGGRVDCVEPSFHKNGKAFITILRYQLDDWKPYIFKTENFGRRWELLTDGLNGIPADYPVRVVREDPEQEGLLFAGTEYGLFISMDDGNNWHPFQQNLPITPITDIKIHRGDLVLSTMGRSFWIMDDISSLRQIAVMEQRPIAHLFVPSAAYRMHYRPTGSNAVPSYPRPALNIDYYLASEPQGDISLDILDKDGQVIRSFTSAEPARDTAQSEPDMATGFSRRGGSPKLKKKAGMHRFAWDMRHAGPWDANANRSGNGRSTSCSRLIYGKIYCKWKKLYPAGRSIHRSQGKRGRYFG